MEAVKKYWLWGIFISILTVFAMSYNANAIDFNINYNNYDLLSNQSNPEYNLIINNVGYTNKIGKFDIPYLVPETHIEFFRSITSYDYKKGDIFEFYVSVFTLDTYNLGNGSLALHPGSRTTNDANLKILGIDLVSSNIIPDIYINSNTNVNNIVESIYGYGSARNFSIYRITIQALNDGSGNIGLTAPINDYIFRFYSQRVDNNGTPSVAFNFNYLKWYRFVGSEENREQEQKTQEAADASETAGGDSSSDAQTGTTSLINAITGAVTVISSASPTNCRINGNMGNLDMGQLDLCANPAPAFVQTIGSLILILMCVPLAITLFNRFISLFRSFQS